MKYYRLLIYSTISSITPILVILSILTEGRILPTLINHSRWTIEYIPMVLCSLLGIVLSIIAYKRIGGKSGLIVSCTLNLIFTITFAYAVLDLWGDKY